MRHLIAGCCLLLTACDFQPRHAVVAPPALRHSGKRQDIAPTDYGNALFNEAQYLGDGSRLITYRYQKSEVRAWDAHDGKLVATFSTQPPVWGTWIVDSRSKRLLGRNRTGTLEVIDLETGRQLVEFPEGNADLKDAVVLDIGGDSNTVIIGKAGGLMLWSLDSGQMLRSAAIETPGRDFHPRCTGIPDGTGKRCWERSPTGQWLAMAFTSERSRNAGTLIFLIDTRSLAARPLMPPDGMWRELDDRSVVGFAFSNDGERLAIGTSWGVWVYGTQSGKWERFFSGEDRGVEFPLWQKLTGGDPPGLYLGAMGFSDDGNRLVALGNALRTYVFDVTTGATAGRASVPPANWVGTFRVSANGSRGIVYRLGTDVLEIIDGHDARQVGWICPYFCTPPGGAVTGNTWLGYAVSPNGKAVAVSRREYGAGVWATDQDSLLFPLNDPALVPDPPRPPAR